MRTRNEIMQLLLDKLSTQESGAWARLGNSLIGKELLAFGAEVIAASDMVKDSLVQSFDYKTADERALISLSHVHDIGVSFVTPSYIKLRVLDTSRNFKPFDLSYTVGNVKFTNITYAIGAEDIILYQGVVKSMKTGDDISGFNIEKNISWDKTVLPIADDKVMTGHNIGAAFPESVYMFFKDANTQGLISAYSPLRYGPEIACYKLYTLMDKSIMVLDGDGVWGKSSFDNATFQIVWLELTNKEFTTTGKLSSKTQGLLEYEIKASAHGGEGSLEQARSSFRKFYLTANAVVSKEQIRDFVNSYRYVQDCAVTASEGVVEVYVKPTDPNDSGEYGEIGAVLDLRGGIITSHEIKKGTAITFAFACQAKSASTTIQSQVQNYLTEAYAYENLSYEATVDVASISADIQARFGVPVKVLFDVKDINVASGDKLQFLPNEGTVELYNNGLKIGYDINGYLFAERESGQNGESLPIGTQNIGDYFVDTTYSKCYTTERSLAGTLYIKMVSGTVIATQLGLNSLSDAYFGACTHNGNVYVYRKIPNVDRTMLAVYSTAQITPQGMITNIVPISGATNKTVGTLTKMIPAQSQAWPVSYNGKLYVVRNNGVQIVLEYYSGEESEPYYRFSAPVVAAVIVGLYLQSNSMYIVLAGDNYSNVVLEIEHFNSSSVSWSMKTLEVPSAESGKLCRSFHSLKDGNCAVALVPDSSSYSTVTLYKVAGLTTNGATVSFLNAAKIKDISLSSAINKETVPLEVVRATKDYIYYCDGTTKVVVYCSDKQSYSQATASYQGYELMAGDVIGSVNYIDGTIVYSGMLAGMTLSYKALNVRRDEKSYLVLDENTPVTWS